MLTTFNANNLENVKILTLGIKILFFLWNMFLLFLMISNVSRANTTHVFSLIALAIFL